MYTGIQMILKYTNTPFVYRNSLTIDQESPSWLTTSSPRQASPLWSTGRLALGCGRLIRQQGDRSHEKKSIYVYMYNYVYIYIQYIYIYIYMYMYMYMYIYIYMYMMLYTILLAWMIWNCEGWDFTQQKGHSQAQTRWNWLQTNGTPKSKDGFTKRPGWQIRIPKFGTACFGSYLEIFRYHIS